MFPASDVVVGATSVDATAEFFAVAGFTPQGASTGGVHLLQQGASGAGIVVLEASGPSVRREPYAAGPAAIDVYTSDIAQGAAAFEAAGYEVGRFADLSIGPVTLKQVRIHGPDHVPVVLVETSHRRSSLLDQEPDRLFSEGHSLVWVVNGRDDEASWWVDRGATKGMNLDFDTPATSVLLDLPDESVAVAMTMLSDEAVGPFRLELLEFTHMASGARARQDADLPGIQGLRFNDAEGEWAVSPGGVRYQAV
ncbi:MAG: hypothetical protein ACR2N2_11735 [Acidimicrobiia bacterium]